MSYTIYNKITGEIVDITKCIGDYPDIVLDNSLEVLPGVAPDHGNYYVEMGTLVALPPKPNENTTFDYSTKQWVDVRTLEFVKAQKRQYINVSRLKANRTSFQYLTYSISCDALSRSDIDGINGYVALYNDFPSEFPGAWKTIDNTYVPIPDVNTWKEFYGAMVSQGSNNFLHAQNLKSQLEAATTIAEVDAIVW